MTTKLRTDTGVVVEASERAAKRLNEQFGWKYILDEPSPVETVSAPVAPKKRGRPKKEPND